MAPAIFLLAACEQRASKQEVMMSQIEREIILSHGAKPLSQYARYYAQDDRGRVYGSYTPEEDALDLESTRQYCLRLQKQGAFKEQAPPFPCSANGGPVRLIKLGKRLWLDSWEELPTASGGSCGYVQFEYEPKSRTFQHLECNGPY